MPLGCDGCGEATFTLEHALSCKKGGLITRRHNEVRVVIGELIDKAWGRGIRGTRQRWRYCEDLLGFDDGAALLLGMKN